MQNVHAVPVKPGMFRSWLAGAAAIFLFLAALAGLGSVLYLADPSYHAALTHKILISGIVSISARATWKMVHIIASVICFLCPALLSLCMIRIFRGKAAASMNLLATVVHWLHLILRIVGWAMIALFCYRFIRYFIGISRRQDWPYQLFATVIMEALMLVLAVSLYRFVQRFLAEAEGCASSVGYTLSSGFLDSGSVPAYVSGGLNVFAAIELVLTVDRMISMTIAYDGLKEYYAFVWVTHPGQWLCVAALFFGAVGNLLLSAYLRLYRRRSERAIFFASREKKHTEAQS